MANDDRNFRSSYYEKVGCLGVEEKKSLNKLLQDSVRNHAKLKQFILSYAVPATQRALLWSIIMRILPLHKNSTDYVMEQRKQVYDDLLRAVTVMRYVDQSTSKSAMFHVMWQCENERLLHPNLSARDDDNIFIEIVNVLLEIFENDVEIYWIATEFYKCAKDIQDECAKLKELTQTLLKREDIAMHNQLEMLGLFGNNCSILDNWYIHCFAGVISEIVLIKVWDKIAGGSRKIVIFLFLELVKTLREPISACNNQNDLKAIIDQVKDQDAVIVNKAIKTWQSNKNHSEIDYSH